MGRGRAKAKQTKVARELKYSSQGTDFEALQRELASGSVERSDMTEADKDEYDDWVADNQR
ncbi:MAG TPA: DUF3073 domain-containing protein [Actinomycetes bacterium]|jgi:hypothetical protein|nr:DUF3073 domain-containing protein [Actinomycetes bacterium]